MFLIDLEIFYCLMTNDNIISDESINNSHIINITYEENKTVSIKLNKNKRYIKSFKDKDLDITVIEILNEDNISEKYFLVPEFNNLFNNKLINNEIYYTTIYRGIKIKKFKRYNKRYK